MMSRHAARLLCALGVALSFSTPRLSHAQDDATIEMARQRFREGVQFYDSRQFEKARLAFLQAYAIKPHPSVLLNLAQSELRSGHPDDAASHFSQYLRTNTGATDAERQETTLGYNTAKSRVGEVALSVDPSGAEVLVDGNDKGVAPLADPLYLLPGSHTIEARSGDRHASKSITLGAGQSVTVQLQARSAMAAAGAPTGAEAPSSEPSEETEAAPPPGPVETPAEQPPAPEPEEPVAPPSGDTQGFGEWFASKPAAWVLAGVGVVGLGVGVTMAFVASHDYDNANTLEKQILDAWTSPHPYGEKGSMSIIDSKRVSKSPCSLAPSDAAAIGSTTERYDTYGTACAEYTSNKNGGDTARTVAIVGSAVGGAALIGTVIYYFADRRTPKKEAGGGGGFHAHIVPWTGPTGAGVGVFGSF
jgi:hypothetical protein